MTFWVVCGAAATSIVLGAAVGMAGRHLHQAIASEDPVVHILGVVGAASLGVIMAYGLWKGLGYAARHTMPPIASLAVVAGGIAIATGRGTGAGALTLLAFLAVMLVLFALGVLARALAGTVGTLMFVIVAVSGAMAGRLFQGGVVALVVAVVSAISGRRMLAGKDPSPLLVRLTNDLACLAGTRFRDADLTGARFDGAHLASTDFRGAMLTDTSFEGAVLERCVFDESSRPPGLGRSPDSLGHEG